MFRWTGDQNKSEEQIQSRNQRAARRYIQSIPSSPSDSEDHFSDCDTSFSRALNLDGDDDSSMDAAALAAEKAKPFEDANFPDDPEAWKKEIKIKV